MKRVEPAKLLKYANKNLNLLSRQEVSSETAKTNHNCDYVWK